MLAHKLIVAGTTFVGSSGTYGLYKYMNPAAESKLDNDTKSISPKSKSFMQKNSDVGLDHELQRLKAIDPFQNKEENTEENDDNLFPPRIKVSEEVVTENSVSVISEIPFISEIPSKSVVQRTRIENRENKSNYLRLLEKGENPMRKNEYMFYKSGK